MADSAQKTEQPTPRRLEKARKEGQFPVSPEFLSAAHFAASLTLLFVFLPSWTAGLLRLFPQGIRAAFEWDGELWMLVGQLYRTAQELFLPMLLSGFGAVLAAFLVQMAQTRFGLAAAKLKPDLGRLNPAARLSSVFSRNVGQLAYALVLIPVLGLMLATVVRSEWVAILRLPGQDVAAGAAWTAGWIGSLLRTAGALVMLLGIADLVRQVRRHNKKLRMSKQEIKEEMKEVDGNPLIKAKIRRMQRDLLRRKMIREVPKATMVVVNPTHFAVALRFVPGEMAAPKVVAKGKNYLAMRIRKIAQEHQVPVVENPPLAQALYKLAAVGQDIPPQLYRAVAEVLAYIYRVMRGRTPA